MLYGNCTLLLLSPCSNTDYTASNPLALTLTDFKDWDLDPTSLAAILLGMAVPALCRAPTGAIWCLIELQALPGRDSCTDKRRPLPLGHPSSHIWWELASGWSALRVWKKWDWKKREILEILAKLLVKSRKLQAGIVYVITVLPQSHRWLQLDV